jgi:SAM-dependent methyltransferase
MASPKPGRMLAFAPFQGVIRRMSVVVEQPEEPRIDTEVAPAELQALLAHVENCWRHLGMTEPHWSVLTNPQFKADRIAANTGDFYASGSYDLSLFINAANRCGVALPFKGTCFELGCGVGRASVWLAKSFRHVIAADVSASHLALAEMAALDGNQSNVTFRLVNEMGAFYRLPTFDSFFSLIVLQHNPPPVIRWLIETMLFKLNHGGVGWFQVPTFLPRYTFDAAAYLAARSDHGEMEMHALPHQTVLDTIADAGCELLEAREHDCLGIANSTSMTFLIRKPVV